MTIRIKTLTRTWTRRLRIVWILKPNMMMTLNISIIQVLLVIIIIIIIIIIQLLIVIIIIIIIIIIITIKKIKNK